MFGSKWDLAFARSLLHGRAPRDRGSFSFAESLRYSFSMSFPVVNGLRGIEFGTKGEFREELIALILKGQKRATAGTLEWDYKAEGEVVEHVGERLAVFNSDGLHVATIQATKVDVVRFADVPTEFALAEGEGDLSGDDFRESHLRYWTRAGLTITDDTEIVLLYFDLVEQFN